MPILCTQPRAGKRSQVRYCHSSLSLSLSLPRRRNADYYRARACAEDGIYPPQVATAKHPKLVLGLSRHSWKIDPKQRVYAIVSARARVCVCSGGTCSLLLGEFALAHLPNRVSETRSKYPGLPYIRSCSRVCVCVCIETPKPSVLQTAWWFLSRCGRALLRSHIHTHTHTVEGITRESPFPRGYARERKYVQQGVTGYVCVCVCVRGGGGKKSVVSKDRASGGSSISTKLYVDLVRVQCIT